MRMTVLVTKPAEDGRKARSEASRRAIVAAMLALVRDGNVAPSAEDVAARGKVGLRTVFRHFENMDSLYREMSALMRAEIVPLAEKPFVSIGWRANLDELIACRAELFERILPVKVASDVVQHRSDFVKADSARLVRMQRRALEDLLPPAVRNDPVLLEALDLALSFDSWRRLRRDQKLPPAKARAVMEEMAARLLR